MGIGLEATAVAPDDSARAALDAARFAAPSPAELAPRFPQLEILELVGQGGMGAVYKARQPALDRLVAVKILPPEVAKDPGFTERFTREARSLARLSHPNIVAVHDFGQTDGQFYFVMEFVDGLNLRQMLRSGVLKASQALAIVPQICEALQFAHDEGLVHRDIKPENILLDKNGRVKIADFGLAKLLGKTPADFALTTPGYVMGTPHYMAPEQLERPLEVDHRADIYSLGVVFYEMLTRELPLGRFDPPSQRVQVDVRLDQVVLKALERERERRYQQVSEVKTAVDMLSAPGDAAATPAPARPLAFPLRVQLGICGLYFACWILTAGMFSLGWPGLAFALVAMLAATQLGARWIVARLPALERELASRSPARKVPQAALAIVLFSVGWAGIVALHFAAADSYAQGPATDQLSAVLTPEYRGKASLLESLDLDRELPSEDDLLVWAKGGASLRGGRGPNARLAIWAGLMGALMIAAIALFLDSRRYRYTWAHYWKPHLTLCAALFGSLALIHLILFLAPIHGSSSSRHWPAALYDAPLEDVQRAVNAWSAEEDYVTGGRINAAVRHVEEKLDMARIWSVELIPESPFDRFHATWTGVRRPKPRVLLECVSPTFEPTRTRVSVRTDSYRIPSREAESWSPVIERLFDALDGLGS